ncbi:MAG: hypothetical protein JWO35_623 [Candidatus Saccharibacteria bacterium]|nr:hypothetical protein [Candidatus Saccharibacteria bacterium]
MQPNDYAFITNPDKPVRKQSLPGSNSPVIRALVVSGGLLILIILFVIVKGLLSGGSALPAYESIAQDQQSMIHLATNATQEKTLSGTNQNFAITAQLSLTSDQSSIISYLATNGTKVDAKKLGIKVSPVLDKQLTDAAAASNYDRTFAQIMKTKLTNYEQALQQTYTKTKGPKGRELLSNQYKSAQLLVQQLEAANK